jgi:hypothetical protein
MGPETSVSVPLDGVEAKLMNPSDAPTKQNESDEEAGIKEAGLRS